MYIEGQRANEFHKLVYRPVSKFGYKDFLPMFHAEKFNPQEWAELIRRGGPVRRTGYRACRWIFYVGLEGELLECRPHGASA